MPGRGDLPLVGFLVGGGLCCFEIDKGAADITINDVGELGRNQAIGSLKRLTDHAIG